MREKVEQLAKSMLEEVEKTRQWRGSTGMKPATDVSAFCSVNPSGLREIEWYARRLLEAVMEA